MTVKLTKNQIAGYRAAHTRKIQKIDQRVKSGELTIQQAAGEKSWSKRRLNEKLALAAHA